MTVTPAADRPGPAKGRQEGLPPRPRLVAFHCDVNGTAAERHFGSKVYKTAVPRNVRLSEAPSHGMPVIAYDRLSRGAEAYGAVAEEFLRRNRA